LIGSVPAEHFARCPVLKYGGIFLELFGPGSAWTRLSEHSSSIGEACYTILQIRLDLQVKLGSVLPRNAIVVGNTTKYVKIFRTRLRPL
jgi:hypothetical protein